MHTSPAATGGSNMNKVTPVGARRPAPLPDASSPPTGMQYGIVPPTDSLRNSASDEADSLLDELLRGVVSSSTVSPDLPPFSSASISSASVTAPPRPLAPTTVPTMLPVSHSCQNDMVGVVGISSISSSANQVSTSGASPSNGPSFALIPSSSSAKATASLEDWLDDMLS